MDLYRGTGTKYRGRRLVFHVSPMGNRWQVTRYPGSKRISKHNKQRTAIAKAKKIAKNNKPSEVKIHDKRGVIRERNTYQADPYPPKG